jgi:hypothetical protein
MAFKSATKTLAAVITTGMVAFPALTSTALANATEPVDVKVEFVEPITLTETQNLDFGMLSTDMVATNTLTIATDDSLTDTNGLKLDPAATQKAADITMTATASQTVSISVAETGSATGYSLGSFKCKYAAGSETACGSSDDFNVTTSASTTLTIGATLTGNGSDAAGVDDSAITVTATYD